MMIFLSLVVFLGLFAVVVFLAIAADILDDFSAIYLGILLQGLLLMPFLLPLFVEEFRLLRSGQLWRDPNRDFMLLLDLDAALVLFCLVLFIRFDPARRMRDKRAAKRSKT